MKPLVYRPVPRAPPDTQADGPRDVSLPGGPQSGSCEDVGGGMGAFVSGLGSLAVRAPQAELRRVLPVSAKCPAGCSHRTPRDAPGDPAAQLRNGSWNLDKN